MMVTLVLALVLVLLMFFPVDKPSQYASHEHTREGETHSPRENDPSYACAGKQKQEPSRATLIRQRSSRFIPQLLTARITAFIATIP